METKKKKIGFILNPYAGIGGKAGLKGSDNYKKIEKLLLEGCERTASKRAESCMNLKSHVMWCYVQKPTQAAQKIRSFVHKL